MKIKVINVEVTPKPAVGKGRPYAEAQVLYMNERDEPKKWKLVSFSNPQVFDEMSAAKNGDVYEITTTKNGEYTNWAAATKYDPSTQVATATAPETQSKPAATGSYGRDFESKEERALKQRLIVRQSSLAQAIAFLPDDAGLEATLDTADQMAKWVYKEPDLFEMANDLPL